MTSDDVWQNYAKGVKKFKKTKTVAILKPVDIKPLHKVKIKTPLPTKFYQDSQKHDFKNILLDRRVEKKIRSGEFSVDAKIDLHGMTQAEAFDALAQFMAIQVKIGRRNLLVITGKGKGMKGILRTNLPHWLESLPESSQILTLRPAALKHGGDGAFYVLLKKKKPEK